MTARLGFVTTAFLLAFGGAGLFLLLADRPFGTVDTGAAGFALVALASAAALYRVRTLPATGIESAISQGEWHAWIGMAFMAIAAAYLVDQRHAFAAGELLRNADAKSVARTLGALLATWLVLTTTLGARSRSAVQLDERDEQIRTLAARVGRAATTSALVALAVMLGASAPERLQWATHPMIACQLVLILIVGWLVEYAVAGTRHWLDRR